MILRGLEPPGDIDTIGSSQLFNFSLTLFSVIAYIKKARKIKEITSFFFAWIYTLNLIFFFLNICSCAHTYNIQIYIYMRYLEWFINFLKFGFSLGFNFIWWVPIRIPFRNKRLVYPIHLFSDCSLRILRMNRRSMILLKKYIYISSIHLIRKSCIANTHRLVTRQGCKSPWERMS